MFVDHDAKKRIVRKIKDEKKKIKETKKIEETIRKHRYAGQITIFETGKIKKLSEFGGKT